MRQVVKKVSLTQPAPIQVDSTEPEVIEAALEQIPGRAIVNSVNLEAGRGKIRRVVPGAPPPGAPPLPLANDGGGVAKNPGRQEGNAPRTRQLALRGHEQDRQGLDR